MAPRNSTDNTAYSGLPIRCDPRAEQPVRGTVHPFGKGHVRFSALGEGLPVHALMLAVGLGAAARVAIEKVADHHMRSGRGGVSSRPSASGSRLWCCRPWP